MNRLFAYGSLMCDDIMFRVAGHCQSEGAARLNGYRRLGVKGEKYPAIVHQAGYVVDGVLYGDVSDIGMARLDDFEGEMYLRQPVEIQTNEGKTVEAFTYVFRPEFAHLLSEADWQFTEFLKTGKTSFVAKYVGFSKI